jgi:hypothetical protein
VKNNSKEIINHAVDRKCVGENCIRDWTTMAQRVSTYRKAILTM